MAKILFIALALCAAASASPLLDAESAKDLASKGLGFAKKWFDKTRDAAEDIFEDTQDFARKALIAADGASKVAAERAARFGQAARKTADGLRADLAARLPGVANDAKDFARKAWIAANEVGQNALQTADGIRADLAARLPGVVEDAKEFAQKALNAAQGATDGIRADLAARLPGVVEDAKAFAQKALNAAQGAADTLRAKLPSLNLAISN